jgi:DNA-binding transcriptional ArsR family regulator
MSSSAKRALRILEFVSDSDHPLGVTEIARVLSLAPATVFRSLDALSRADLVSRYQSSSRYVLGAAADRLCQSLIARFRIRELSLPYLRQLASVSGESASLHVRLGWYSVRIASAPGTAEVTNAPAIGDTRALGDTYALATMLPLGKPTKEITNDKLTERYLGSRTRRNQFPRGDSTGGGLALARRDHVVFRDGDHECAGRDRGPHGPERRGPAGRRM